MCFGVVKVGLDGTNSGNPDLQVCFFFEFPNNCFVDILIIFHVAAGDAPQAPVAAVSPAQKDPPVLIKNHCGHPDDGVFI
jgi:hypothetical protein